MGPFFHAMHDQIEKIRGEALAFLASNAGEEEMERYERSVIGRSGSLQSLFDALKSMTVEEKREFGPLLNGLKSELEAAFTQAKKRFTHADAQKLDVTMLMKQPPRGSLHPVTIVVNDLHEIFSSMGFRYFDAPMVDTDYYNFEALNIPKHHPARDMQDTFYLTNPGYVLRTHVSNTQNRILREAGMPIRVFYHGKVFRNEATDASHDYEFHQFEVMMVGKDVSLANLKFVTQSFLTALFGREVKTRFRPGYFPFVEPGLELDFSCLVCDGQGCRVCKHSGWVEFMGCGMIHPNVLREGGLDPKEYTGFAFGCGLSRLVMMRYKLEDVRMLHSADLRFLEQFA